MPWDWTCECGVTYEVPDSIQADSVAMVNCCPRCEPSLFEAGKEAQ